jgi:hypothetical protein
MVELLHCTSDFSFSPSKDESVLSDPTYNASLLFGKRDEVPVLVRKILYTWDFIYFLHPYVLQASTESNIPREHETPPV